MWWCTTHWMYVLLTQSSHFTNYKVKVRIEPSGLFDLSDPLEAWASLYSNKGSKFVFFWGESLLLRGKDRRRYDGVKTHYYSPCKKNNWIRPHRETRDIREFDNERGGGGGDQTVVFFYTNYLKTATILYKRVLFLFVIIQTIHCEKQKRLWVLFNGGNGKEKKWSLVLLQHVVWLFISRIYTHKNTCFTKNIFIFAKFMRSSLLVNTFSLCFFSCLHKNQMISSVPSLKQAIH